MTLEFEGKLARIKTPISFFVETDKHITYKGTLDQGEFVLVLGISNERAVVVNWKAKFVTSDGLIGVVFMWHGHPRELLELVE